jgi:protein-S-isoprenylcysteine O-methyltransferase Ste14
MASPSCGPASACARGRSRRSGASSGATSRWLGDQVVGRTGPYAAIRHPAYAGNLLMLAGFGIVLANWASLAALVVIPFWATCPGSPSTTRS